MKDKLKMSLGDRGIERIRIVRKAVEDLRASFRPVAGAPMYPLEISEIRSVLEGFGIRRGDILHVHTSVSHLMRASFRPPSQPIAGLRTYSKALLEMLQDLIGESGTLTMGTDFERSAGWLKRLMAGVPVAGDVFDPAKSLSNRGLVSEYFRKLPGARRSVHPYYNLTAWGRHADELVRDHHLSTPYVQDSFSPWCKITEGGAKVALLGRTFEVNSLVHLVEYLHPAEYPRPLFMSGPVSMPYIDHGGTARTIAVTLHSAGVPGSLHFTPHALHAFGAYLNSKYGEIYRVRQYASDVGIVCYQAKAQYDAFLSEMRDGVTWVRSTVSPVTSLLYYAGMAHDRQTEQIGLAISEDGGNFQRANGDGLIIPIERRTAWKSIRTCNPTVLRFRNEWWMFYQGVGPQASDTRVTHVIAVARSSDALSWQCDEEPVLTFEHARSACPALHNSDGGGVIEPAVIVAGDELHMHFVAYRGHYSEGTWLYRALSVDGQSWRIDPSWELAGDQFGNFRLHYPQVREDAGTRMIWFSLIDRQSRAAAIVQMRSTGGDGWGDTMQLLPTSVAGLRVTSEEAITLQLNGRRVRGVDRLNQTVSRWLHSGRNYFGYSHPHVIDTRLFYHAYHRSNDGRSWMDIGCCNYTDSSTSTHAVVLRPSPSTRSWDSYFVADPFVIKV